MSDPRLTPDPALVTQHHPARIAVPFTDLCRTPAGARDRQLLFGDQVTVLGEREEWLYVQSGKDGYCGYIWEKTITDHAEATHYVSALASHIYLRPDFKSPDIGGLSLGSQIRAEAIEAGYARIDSGFVPLVHLTPISRPQDDPAAVAALFLGTPYLWGGNTMRGIDCSGLVQAALLACGIPCPGDSDMQMALGQPAQGGYQRNDLLFWKGHVALVHDADTLIHANAHAMACTYEPIKDAIARIRAQGDGPVTAHRRL